MNGFRDWKSGSALQNALSPQGSAQKVNNYGSIEEMLRGLLGDGFSTAQKPIEPPKEDQAEAAMRRVQELAAAAEKVTKMQEDLEKKIEEETKESEIVEDHQPEPEPEPVVEEMAIEEVEPATKAYRVFRDKDENFECKISIQGAGLNAAQARLVFDTDLWNITFYGKIYKDGRCLIPIKKSIPLPEGTRGRARLEVIVDEQLFIAWEDDFVVEGSKKVKVELKEQRSVRVSFGKSSEEDK